jgi:hypothetical protein
LVTAVEVTQTGATLGGAVCIEVTVSIVSEMENKYLGTLFQMKGQIPVYSEALTPTLTETTLLQENPLWGAMQYRVTVLQMRLCF